MDGRATRRGRGAVTWGAVIEKELAAVAAVTGGRVVPCEACQGGGEEDFHPAERRGCSACNGIGRIVVYSVRLPGQIRTITVGTDFEP